MNKIDYLTSAKRWRKDSERYLAEGTKNATLVTSLSMQVATFLLGFNVLWFQITTEPISQGAQILITITLASLVLSLKMGIWSTLVTNSYFNKAGRHYEKLSEKMNRYILETKKDTGGEYPNCIIEEENYEYDSLPWQYIAQLTLLLIGMLTSLFIGLLFLWG
jgi:hypothetical protein